MTTTKTHIEGLDINIISKNENKDISLIFIHGNSLDSTSFQSQFDAIEFENYHLVGIDLPGHGNSSRSENPADNYSVRGYCEILQKVISSLNLNHVILVGHSLGGHIAIELTTQLPSIKGLVIFGTPPIGIPPAMDQMFLPNPNMGLLFQDILQETDITILQDLYHTGYFSIDEAISKSDGNARTYLGESIALGKFLNEREICQNLTIPLLLIHGENDSLVNLDYLKDLELPTLHKNQIQVIEKSGHSPQITHHDAFNSVLLEFINC